MTVTVGSLAMWLIGALFAVVMTGATMWARSIRDTTVGISRKIDRMCDTISEMSSSQSEFKGRTEAHVKDVDRRLHFLHKEIAAVRQEVSGNDR